MIILSAIHFVLLAADVSGSLPPQDGLMLWLDAADKSTLRLDRDVVETWASKAPGVAQTALSEGSQRPKWRMHEGAVPSAAVYFDGLDDVLRIPSFNRQADTWTLFLVCAPFSPVKGGGLCSACPRNGHDYDPGFTVDLYQSSTAFDQLSVEGAGRIGGQKDQMQSVFTCGGMHVVAVVRQASEIRLFMDGKDEGARPAMAARTVMEELRVGARYYGGAERQHFHGEIAHVLLYDRELKPEERQSVEQLLRIPEKERVAGELRAAQQAAREKEERLKNRMKPPRILQSWPNLEQFLADQTPPLDTSRLPVRTDLREAISLGMRHMNSLYDADRDNEPFFYANCMADGTGKMFHSVNIGIPHVVGRCLLACMMGEMATGNPFPSDGLAILERYCKQSFDNPDHLNSYFDPNLGNARCVEFHNMREGLYGLWALTAGRNSTWARDTAHAMLETLDRITDPRGIWSLERIAELGMTERCFGVAIPNASRMVDPLLAYHDCTGDPLAMKLAGLYARQGLSTVFTPNGRFAPMERSSGHVHSITSSLSGIASYAANRDQAMLEACVRIMDSGVPEYFSSWGWGDEVFPEHPADELSRGEINQTGDIIRTALILGEAGFPRFFELAERYLRSMVLPTQHHEAELSTFLKDKEKPADDSERNVLQRTVGGYAMQLPNDRMRRGDWPLSTLDITSGAVHALSECHRRRALVQDGTCTVNLLFDFEDERITIHSGLPLKGRIDFTAKQEFRSFRIVLPGWLDVGTVRAAVNEEQRQPMTQSGYLSLGALQSGDNGAITFDLPCKRETETVDGVEYTTTWIGSQVIAILPRGAVSPLPF